MSPFETYQSYLAMKNHWTNVKYDFFLYNKKVRATTASFNRRKDKYWFERLSRKYDDKEVVDFLLSNFAAADNPQNLWVGELIKNGNQNYSKWKNTQQSLPYLFKEQSEILLSDHELEKLLECSKGHPIILKKHLSGELSLETFTIWESIFSFVKNLDKKLKDPVWETVSMKINKYKSFININMHTYKKILRDIVND